MPLPGGWRQVGLWCVHQTGSATRAAEGHPDTNSGVKTGKTLLSAKGAVLRRTVTSACLSQVACHNQLLWVQVRLEETDKGSSLAASSWFHVANSTVSG
eukprot:3934870-Rhodomonas_salina.2